MGYSQDEAKINRRGVYHAGIGIVVISHPLLVICGRALEDKIPLPGAHTGRGMPLNSHAGTGLQQRRDGNSKIEPWPIGENLTEVAWLKIRSKPISQAN